MWKSKFWQRKIPPNDSRKFSEEIIGLTPTPAVDSLAAAAQGWRYSHLKVILIVIHVFRLLHHFKRNLNLSEDRWLWFRDNVYETFYDVVNNFSIPSHLRSIYFIHSRSFSCVDLIFWLQVQRDSMWASQREMLQLEHVNDSLTLDTNWRAHTTNYLSLSLSRTIACPTMHIDCSLAANWNAEAQEKKFQIVELSSAVLVLSFLAASRESGQRS